MAGTWWVDGSMCGPSSVGMCVIEPALDVTEARLDEDVLTGSIRWTGPDPTLVGELEARVVVTKSRGDRTLRRSVQLDPGRFRLRLPERAATVSFRAQDAAANGTTAVTTLPVHVARDEVGADQSSIVGPGADLTGRNLAGVDLEGLDLTGANLSGADLTTARLVRATMPSVTAKDAKFVNAQMMGADLTGAIVSGANLSSARLQTATLNSVAARGTRFVSADFTDARLRGADLHEADFAFARLRDADLTGAAVGGAKFAFAKTGGATWANGSRCPAGHIGRCPG